MNIPRTLVITAFAAVLTACGSNFEWFPAPLPPDSTPNQFTFIDQCPVVLNTSVESNTITISGINEAVPITISGGEYSLNGAAYTSTAGTLRNSDQVKVRPTGGLLTAARMDVVLTVGGVSDTFTVSQVCLQGTN